MGCAVLCLCTLVLLFIPMDMSKTQQPFWNSINLPDEHIPYFLNNNPDIKTHCAQEKSCPFKRHLSKWEKCWGYEEGCDVKNRMLMPSCTPREDKRRSMTKEELTHYFWTQGDFGYVQERKKEFMDICQPENKDTDSSLVCAKYTRYCYGKNIYMDLSGLHSESSNVRYREDVFSAAGMIGGKCKVDHVTLKSLGEHKSPLQSWFAEVENFSSLKFHPFEDKKCDVYIDKPTVVMKLDAGINMYHHFCDFINLYTSQHINNSFSEDINIIHWDTSKHKYGDFFHDTWKVFSKHPVMHLNQLSGKKVCFRQVMFPLLARMRGGMYYNQPLAGNCIRTGLFRAFSQHILHRLKIKQEGPLEEKIRITLLSRGTKYRKILNQDELVRALRDIPEYEVKVVDYNGKYPFLEQLQVTYNSDILIGMHGAGLTHMLFQPDWGVIFEISNCGDHDCYHDLARLRGMHYMTWEKPNKMIQEDEGHHPTLGAHQKFTNYSFDKDEFLRMISKAVKYIRSNASFKKALKKRYPKTDKDEL